MNAHQRRKHRRHAVRELRHQLSLCASGVPNAETWDRTTRALLSARGRQIEYLQEAISAVDLSAPFRGDPRFGFRRQRLRDLQRQEADDIGARFAENCELKPGEGYAALEYGARIIAKHEHLVVDDADLRVIGADVSLPGVQWMKRSWSR